MTHWIQDKHGMAEGHNVHAQSVAARKKREKGETGDKNTPFNHQSYSEAPSLNTCDSDHYSSLFTVLPFMKFTTHVFRYLLGLSENIYYFLLIMEKLSGFKNKVTFCGSSNA